MSPVKKPVKTPNKVSRPRGRPRTVRAPALVQAEIVTPAEAESLVTAPQAALAAPALTPAPAPTPVATRHSRKYFYAVGRRKSAVATVKLMPGKGEMKVNGFDLKIYFPTPELQKAALAPLSSTNQAGQVDVQVQVYGGGKRGQADSVRHGLARALVQMDQEFKPTVKKLGFLTRDARVKERKKYGLKGARRAPQWQKR